MEAGRAKYRFGAVARANAEAIGNPGQRTFRLLLESGAASASMWLEKEQLYQLGLYIQEIVGSLSDDDRSVQSQSPEPEWSGAITNVDFKAGKLALGHDKASNCFLIVAHEVEEPEDSPGTLSFWLPLGMGEDLAKEALEACAAGRPRCPLCAQPINPEGHMCPRSNGHGPLED
jgi:uncharacterized repeat protein (TIGR03847 family)